MKTCAICNLQNAPTEATCVGCGEASWLEPVAPIPATTAPRTATPAPWSESVPEPEPSYTGAYADPDEHGDASKGYTGAYADPDEHGDASKAKPQPHTTKPHKGPRR